MNELTLIKTLAGAAGPFRLEISLQWEAGEVIGLMGPSGAGKSSLLRMMAGLMKPESGFLRVGGQDWYQSAKRLHLPPQRRSVGLVFQDYALFPNMRLRENLEFAAERRDPALIDEVLDLMELASLAERYPASLSGGQQQRAALARALVRKPRLLLLDEPLSALDQPLRQRLQTALLAWHQRLGTTTFVVSHDRSEVARLAGRVFCLEAGRVVRQGQPARLFARPFTEARAEVIALHPETGEATLSLGGQLHRLPAQPGWQLGQQLELRLGDAS
jgi:molybdate transport system ATP-binding protein